MKTSMFLTGAGALLAVASPIDKRAMETDWVYEVVTVTVTAGVEASAAAVFVEKEPAAPTTTTTVPEPQEVQPEPIVIKTTIVDAPAAEPTTSSSTSTKAVKTTTTQAAAETVETGVSSSSGDYQSVVLEHHNIHRSNHSAPALEWDSTLAQYAANTANGCVFEHDMDQGNGGYGQNLATWGSTGDIDDLANKAAAQGITNMWYNDEMNNWSYYGQDNPPEGLDLNLYGHFTQVVWKDTTKVGCATVRCAAGTVLSFEAWYTVCNYSPQGNFGGEYGNNVLQPLGDKRVTV